MNLLATIDSKYLLPLKNLLVSLGEADTETERIDFYVAHSSLTDEELDLLYDCVKPYGNVNLLPVKVEDGYFEDTPVIERLPKESFYRLIAFDFLPAEVKRVIYLDPDMLIIKPLTALYETELPEDCYFAAANHTFGYVEWLNHLRLKLPKDKKYINSGVMLMDIERLRNNTSAKEIIDGINDNIQKLVLGDQDALNLMFYDNILEIDSTVWNMDEKTLEHRGLDLDYVRKNTAIIHYNGKYKPWNEGYKGQLDVFYPPMENKAPLPKGKFFKKLKAYLNIFKPTKQQKIVAGIFIGFWIITMICYFSFSSTVHNLLRAAIDNPDKFRAMLDRSQGLSEVIFVLVRSIQTVVKVVPAEPLEIGSGYAFGTFGGMFLCLLGNLIGSIVILLLTKKYGRKIVDIFFPSEKIANMSLFKDPVKAHILLFILYLIPGTPKDGFTYFVGLTNLNPVVYLALTTFARIPSIVSSTWCGSTLSEKNYAMSAIIFAVTFVLGVGGGLLYNRFFGTGREKRKALKAEKAAEKSELPAAE